MDYIINFSYKEDNYSGIVAEKAWSKDGNVDFEVCNLDECPEDAIIGRSLFTVDEYLKAIKLGFILAKTGYEKLVIKEVPWEENYD